VLSVISIRQYLSYDILSEATTPSPFARTCVRALTRYTLAVNEEIAKLDDTDSVLIGNSVHRIAINLTDKLKPPRRSCSTAAGN